MLVVLLLSASVAGKSSRLRLASKAVCFWLTASLSCIADHSQPDARLDQPNRRSQLVEAFLPVSFQFSVFRLQVAGFPGARDDSSWAGSGMG